MKTRLLIIIGIIFSGGFVITNAYAMCAESDGPPEPCFDSYRMSYEKITEKSMMESFARNIEINYDDWQMSDRNWAHVGSELELPAIICTEFVADGMKQYRMTKWVDDYKMSDWENHYNPSLCDKWLAPIDDGIKVKWDKELYPSDDIAVIHVIDKDMNLDSTVRDVFQIHVYSDTDHDGIRVIVTETENDAGIFYAKVYLTTTNVSNGHRLLVEDAIYAEHKGNRDFSRIINESEPSTMSDEQQQMMQEYCETGIRHPNMMGIPQCIKNELVCGPGSEYIDGVCEIVSVQIETVGSDGFPLPFLVGLVLLFGILGLIVYFIKRREDN
jgi:hypothetical protein